jgi:hypothetical protein
MLSQTAAVMPGLVPGIHVLAPASRKSWMAGTSPAMTETVSVARMESGSESTRHDRSRISLRSIRATCSSDRGPKIVFEKPVVANKSSSARMK